jgi:hypothetical protein
MTRLIDGKLLLGAFAAGALFVIVMGTAVWLGVQ